LWILEIKERILLTIRGFCRLQRGVMGKVYEAREKLVPPLGGRRSSGRGATCW
jgi:hypothetical protein